MSFREITVCLEREDTAQPLAVMASRLGAGLHAYVNGVHAIPEFRIRGAVSPYIPDNVMQQIKEKARESANTIKESFSKTMSQGDTNWQFVMQECQSSSDFTPYMEFALHSDVVVASQPLVGGEESELLRALLVKAGTPLIIVPNKPDKNTFGERVMVAWNATPESARAVRDAMPLLCNADEVQVVSVGHQEHNLTGGRSVNLDSYLEHHNVTATHHELTGKHLNVSENLLDHARRNDIDLLVMGGFGHSRLYDVVVGAATGEIMKHMHIPVFLSH